VQYVQTKDEFKESCLSEKEREVLYDSLLYQVALRTIYEGYGVADYINQGTNLATMDWEDFEHLVREVFEQEFAGRGGEVTSNERGPSLPQVGRLLLIGA
jgi:hypothetical protein